MAEYLFEISERGEEAIVENLKKVMDGMTNIPEEGKFCGNPYKRLEPHGRLIDVSRFYLELNKFLGNPIGEGKHKAKVSVEKTLCFVLNWIAEAYRTPVLESTIDERKVPIVEPIEEEGEDDNERKD